MMQGKVNENRNKQKKCKCQRDQYVIRPPKLPQAASTSSHTLSLSALLASPGSSGLKCVLLLLSPPFAFPVK
jgi:hypothetical protein